MISSVLEVLCFWGCGATSTDVLSRSITLQKFAPKPHSDSVSSNNNGPWMFQIDRGLSAPEQSATCAQPTKADH